MKRKLTLLFTCKLFFILSALSQVGIGTTTPKPSALLELNSTSKGFLPPRMTTAERNAIANPSHGLHVFNTDQKCLNYYDSLSQVWGCYCPSCGDAIIYIGTNVSNLDFYASYAQHIPASKYIINILPGVTISGGDSALKFTRMLFNAAITINNYGTITGGGGIGGNGAKTSNGHSSCPPVAPATSGGRGGCAIGTKGGVLITVNNYGIIAGGGGGGGGAGSSSTVLGGGGGGGAGITGGLGGDGGWFAAFVEPGICDVLSFASDGLNGQAATGGNGGAGLNGGATGGAGGARGQVGQTGGGVGGAAGGQPGKAIGGGSGNSITNIGGGQSFGVID